MTDEKQLPPGLVLWPGDGGQQRIGVVISDIHCTDCSVGNQTADDSDWKSFFGELEVTLKASITKASEVVLILNGDVVDVLRSGKWAENNVYPWQRNNPGFETTLMSIMHAIVAVHAREPKEEFGKRRIRGPGEEPESSGFFFYLKQMVGNITGKVARVSLIPVAGNHDKELQVVPKARELYYRECLGLEAGDLDAGYRNWVARQMGSDPNDPWPMLPFYYADPSLRLFATHGQWRDMTNSRTTLQWKVCHGWKPQIWQQDRYRAFSDSCFGDTIASGMLSNFIWNTTQAIRNEVIPFAVQRTRNDGIDHILNVLGEMDLYRPSERAVVRLLQEAKNLDRKDANFPRLFRTVIAQYRKSLQSWLGHRETFALAPLPFKILLYVIRALSHVHWTRLDTKLMQLMAWASGLKESTPYAKLPAFLSDYRPLGFHLHAEGHTHVTMEVDLRYNSPPEPRNYTYVNLGAWRNRIVQKYEKKGYRRRCIGRALIVHGDAQGESACEGYSFSLRDITSWGDRLDKW
ncbi:MAG: hypothetical protein HZB47_13710 [Nitrosomonadales bacterium]|nr:hypothetical protein [Nitrosomonadales bacterium]